MPVAILFVSSKGLVSFSSVMSPEKFISKISFGVYRSMTRAALVSWSPRRPTTQFVFEPRSVILVGTAKLLSAALNGTPMMGRLLTRSQPTMPSPTPASCGVPARIIAQR